MAHRVRPYEPRDRDRVRALCCDTGFLGTPIDPVFEDRALFADYLTARYLDEEPESAFVVETDGTVKGYLLGARARRAPSLRTRWRHVRLALRAAVRYPFYKRAQSRKFLRWIVTRAWREVPPAPRDAAHFHVNLEPEARTVAGTPELIDTFLQYLVRRGEKRVYGQMVTFEDRRTEAMFRRYGFRVINRMEVTKFRHLHPGPVYLSTVVRELDGYRGFYLHQDRDDAGARTA